MPGCQIRWTRTRAARAVSFRLGGSHILKVEAQQPAGEELLVGDLAPLLLDELLDLFMVDSCHIVTPYAVFLRLGANTGSKIEVRAPPGPPHRQWPC